MPNHHTPGPWHDDGYRIYAPTDDATDKRNARVIVEYKHLDDFNFADGPFIAAAPAMYEALHIALAYLESINYPINPDVVATICNAMQLAEGLTPSSSQAQAPSVVPQG